MDKLLCFFVLLCPFCVPFAFGILGLVLPLLFHSVWRPFLPASSPTNLLHCPFISAFPHFFICILPLVARNKLGLCFVRRTLSSVLCPRTTGRQEGFPGQSPVCKSRFDSRAEAKAEGQEIDKRAEKRGPRDRHGRNPDADVDRCGPDAHRPTIETRRRKTDDMHQNEANTCRRAEA